MATRSAIGIKHGNRVKAIYCHYDGYLEYVGRILNDYYQSSVKVNKLISLGDMSCIGADIGEKHEFDQRSEYLDDNTARECTFYGRDRGEENVEFNSFTSEDEFVGYYEGSGCEFFYLYDHGVWYCSTGNDFIPLHEALDKVTA